jgi:hypothetical protein
MKFELKEVQAALNTVNSANNSCIVEPERAYDALRTVMLYAEKKLHEDRIKLSYEKDDPRAEFTKSERIEKAILFLEEAANQMIAANKTGEIDLNKTPVLASAYTRAQDTMDELEKTFLT